MTPAAADASLAGRCPLRARPRPPLPWRRGQTRLPPRARGGGEESGGAPGRPGTVIATGRVRSSPRGEGGARPARGRGRGRREGPPALGGHSNGKGLGQSPRRTRGRRGLGGRGTHPLSNRAPSRWPLESLSSAAGCCGNGEPPSDQGPKEERRGKRVGLALERAAPLPAAGHCPSDPAPRPLPGPAGLPAPPHLSGPFRPPCVGGPRSSARRDLSSCLKHPLTQGGISDLSADARPRARTHGHIHNHYHAPMGPSSGHLTASSRHVTRGPPGATHDLFPSCSVIAPTQASSLPP